MQGLRSDFRALGSPCVLHLYAATRSELDRVSELACAELARIEARYSRYREDSIVSEINGRAGSGRPVTVDQETAALLDYAGAAHEQSRGLFDITSGILRRAWNFDVARTPTSEQLRPLCARVGFERVQWKRPTVSLAEPGMEIDFGGFGKEYAADRLAALCRSQGVRHGLIDLGGDLCVIGPHPDGSPWQIGIRDPADPERPLATLPLRRGAVATSGDYERSIVIDGERYSHLLDPRTGWPVRGLAAATVVADQCLVAGTGSTVAMLSGRRGIRWLTRLGLPHLFVTSQGERGGSLWPDESGARRHCTAELAAV